MGTILKSPGVCIIETGIGPLCNQIQDSLEGFGELGEQFDKPCYITLNNLQFYTVNDKKVCTPDEYIPVYKYPKPNYPPQINIIGSEVIEIYQDEVYNDLGATAYDQEDGELTSSIVTINPVDTSIINQYTVIYSVRDSKNLQTIVQRVVNVIQEPDLTIPVITLIGSDIDIYIGLEYFDAGATAHDDTDGDITSEIVTVNPVDYNTLGAYIVTYNVQDSSENDAIEVQRTVNIIAVPDITIPVITLIGTDEIIAEGEVYTDLGATAEDNIDGDITGNIITVNSVNANTPGIYTVTYNVSDIAGNPAVEVQRTVEVTLVISSEEFDQSEVYNVTNIEQEF